MWTQGDPIGKPITSSVKIVEEVQEKLSAAGEVHCMEAVGIINANKHKYHLKKSRYGNMVWMSNWRNCRLEFEKR